MTYIDIETGEYPLFIGDLMLRTGLPEEQAMLVERYQQVPDRPLPEWEKTQRMIELPPVLTNGVWEKQFLVRPETEEEKSIRLLHEAEQQALLGHLYGVPQDTASAGSAPDVVG